MIRKNFLKIFISTTLIMVISFTINYLLSISSFEEFYRTSLISKYKILNEELKSSIEASVNFGKPIYKFSGMDKLLEDIIERENEISNVFVTLPNGKVLYSVDETYLERELLDRLNPKYEGVEIEDVILLGNRYFVISPIYFEKITLVGNVYIEFEKSNITENVMIVIKESLHTLSDIFIVCVVALFLIILLLDYIAKKREEECKMTSSKNFLLIMLILIVSNLSFTFINNRFFKNKYIEIVNENIDYFSHMIKNEIEDYLKIGLTIERLNKIEKILYEKLSEVPECKDIYISDKHNILYSASNDGRMTSKYNQYFNLIPIASIEKDTIYSRIYPLKDGEDSTRGFLIMTLNKELINKNINNLLLDSLTVLIVSVIICFQMLVVVSIISRHDFSNQTPQVQFENNFNIIRMASFLFFFAELIPLSFIPILAKKIYEKNPIQFISLSKDTIISLPLASYMLGAAIFVLIIGYLSNKYSSRKIFISCALLMIIGAVGAAFSTTIVNLIIFRFFSGLGFGGISINSTSFVLKKSDKENVATGFGYWTSGYAAASLCAIPIGGVFVYRFGYALALLVSAFFSLLFIMFVFANIQNEKIEQKDIEKAVFKASDMLEVFKDKNVFANLFFTVVPFQLVYIGIFQYLMPLYMNNVGITQANIGRLLTVFGLVYLFIPIISKYVDKIKKDKTFIFLGNFIIGLSLILFNAGTNFTILLIIIGGMSLGSMLGDAAEESFVTSTHKARELGEAKLMSIYSSYERVVMIFAPLLTGALISGVGYKMSVMAIGGLTLISSLLFLIISENVRE